MNELPTCEELSSWLKEKVKSGEIKVLSDHDIWSIQHGFLEPDTYYKEGSYEVKTPSGGSPPGAL